MECRVCSCGGAKDRHAITRKSHHLADFRVAPFRVFAWRDERSPSENPLNGDCGGFSRGDLSPRQAKIRQTGCRNATHEKCPTFVWRGKRLPCANTKKWPFGGFSRGAFSPFRPENTIIRNGTNQPPYYMMLFPRKGPVCATHFLHYSILQPQSLTPFLYDKGIFICHYTWAER